MLDLTDDALNDLRNIRERIAERIAADNPHLADKKAAEILATCQRIDAFQSIDVVFDGDLRRFSKRPWIILYTKIGVLVQRVFDTRQDWRALLN
jgi:plasmid stabilization system protein ParE